MFSHILIGVDGSKESFRALNYAISIAKQFNGTVDVMYSIPPRVYAELAEREVKIEESSGNVRFISMLQQEENHIRDLVQEIGSKEELDIGFHTRVGDPVEAMIEYVTTFEIELIVVGSSGKGMADRLILGSVSTGIVHKSPVPVLVTKPEA
ncbi:universal stress protein [Methanospirillum sp.]|uniref:universal stress protein n=1 Tax=Methanospirillum sp. TaxID=45200 RepID=UPI0035A108D4